MEIREVTINGYCYEGASTRLSSESVAKIQCCPIGVRAQKDSDIVNAHARREISTYGYTLLRNLLHTAGVAAIELSPDGYAFIGFRNGYNEAERDRAIRDIYKKLP